jgi:hypothetical protein
MQPRFPLYIVSKSRWDSRYTSRSLCKMGVPHFVVVEAEQLTDYQRTHDDPLITLLVLDKQFQADYDTFDDLGLTKSTGPGPARNFAWEHSIASGFSWHWVLDDNIRRFTRYTANERIPMGDGTGFAAMEDFCLRYTNVGMAGPQYRAFAPRKEKFPPFGLNTRIYSCNLIRNDLPFRWRGRYNEDTDLSLRILKAAWCTVIFYAFQQDKITTQEIGGGNTEDFYAKEGTLPKSQMLVRMHPDVARLKYRYGRVHHLVDYRPFRQQGLVKRDDVTIPTTSPYRLTVVPRED